MRWDDLERVQEESVVEVMAEMKGGMSNKKARKGKNLSDDEKPLRGN